MNELQNIITSNSINLKILAKCHDVYIDIFFSDNKSMYVLNGQL